MIAIVIVKVGVRAGAEVHRGEGARSGEGGGRVTAQARKMITAHIQVVVLAAVVAVVGAEVLAEGEGMWGIGGVKAQDEGTSGKVIAEAICHQEGTAT